MRSPVPGMAGWAAALLLLALALPAGAESAIGQNDHASSARPVVQGEPTHLSIHDAARLGSGAAVERFLRADPALREARSSLGSTPLHLAATNPDPSALQVLLAAGAEINARDGEGATPLHMAAYASHARNVRLLLEAGADYRIKTHVGRDPMSLARKVMANEAAGVLALWVLKGCKAGQALC